jgi:hypothetical protein
VTGSETGRPEAWSPFDSDPEALAWARSKIQGRADRYAEWEQKARDEGDEDKAMRWRRLKNMLHMDFIGGEGCVIAGFDERLPQLIEDLDYRFIGIGDGSPERSVTNGYEGTTQSPE